MLKSFKLLWRLDPYCALTMIGVVISLPLTVAVLVTMLAAIMGWT